MIITFLIGIAAIMGFALTIYLLGLIPNFLISNSIRPLDISTTIFRGIINILLLMCLGMLILVIYNVGLLITNQY